MHNKISYRKDGELNMDSYPPKKFHDGKFSKRFLANTDIMVVHNLANECQDCSVDEIIDNGQAKLFDHHWQAQSTGFVNCKKCIGGASKHL